MEEKLKSYRLYIEEQILSGKPHQDIFNDAVTRYDVKIHDIAEILRKSPSLEKRIKYKKLNAVVIVAMVFSMILGVMYYLGDTDNYASLFPGLFGLMLLYGLINFKSPAHLLAGIVLTVLSLMLLGLLLLNFEWRILIEFLFTLAVTVAAYYLNGKLSSDYILNREKLQENPSLRADAIIFTG